jgi:RNA polymerase sigma factor (sigma-70 family)
LVSNKKKTNEDIKKRTAELLEKFAISPDHLRRKIESEIYDLNKGLIILVLKISKIPLSKYDDCYQEASKGLLLAIRRYDGSRGLMFSTFAINTMKGIVKNHHRDNEWHMSVSRIDKERGVRLLKTSIEEHEVNSPENERLMRLISAQTPLSITDQITKTMGETPAVIETENDLVKGILNQLDPKHRFWIDAAFIKGYEPFELSIALIENIEEVNKKINAAVRACRRISKSIIQEENVSELY